MSPEVPDHVLVVGASLAGLSTARALRSQGYAGRLTIVGAERHRPYDRPPLSKEFLHAVDGQVELSLEADDEDLDADWRLGERAIGLRPLPDGGATVELSGGDSIGADRVVVATGASARSGVPGAELPGVHLLRTLDDAIALRDDVHAAVRDQRPVVIVGGGFIGSEVAATARKLGAEVTLVVPEDVPLRGALGPYADPIAELHIAHGVTIRAHSFVRGVRAGTGGLEVVLENGDHIPAATVVLGIGAVPAVGWLAGSGLDLGAQGAGAIRCDEHGATNLDGVFAVGDCAAWHDPGLGCHYHIEHWTSAKERGAVVAARVLGSDRIPRCRPPYVWSDLYGKKLQLAGYRDLADHPNSIEDTLQSGSVAAGSFTAVYRRGTDAVAVLALDQAREFAAVRRRLVSTISTPSQGASA